MLLRINDDDEDDDRPADDVSAMLDVALGGWGPWWVRKAVGRSDDEVPWWAK